MTRFTTPLGDLAVLVLLTLVLAVLLGLAVLP